MRVFILLLVSIGLGATGQLLFKAAAQTMAPFSELGVLGLLTTMFTSPKILGGFACFFVSAVLWILALRSVPLSLAYPMVALSYVIIFAGSYFLFGEPVTWRHWAGALLIVAGILLIAGKG